MRQNAKAQLPVASRQGGYGVLLAKAALARKVPTDLHQLAAVLLKQYVKAHWQDGGEKFEVRAAQTLEGQRASHVDALRPCAMTWPFWRMRPAL